jgi:aminoglycoside 6'-N-acetyltransferase
MPLELQGVHVLLRPTSDAEVALLTSLVNDPEVSLWWGVYDEDKMREEVRDPRLSAWTVVVDGAVAGLVEVTEELEPDYPSVALDIFLGVAFHGRGYGAEALRTVLRHMFEERGHHRATIDPTVENERAIRSYERIGFRPVGILRQAERAPDSRWRDALLMDLLADELC